MLKVWMFQVASPASKPDVAGVIESAGSEVFTYLIAALGLMALLMALGPGIRWMRRSMSVYHASDAYYGDSDDWNLWRYTEDYVEMSDREFSEVMRKNGRDNRYHSSDLEF